MIYDKYVKWLYNYIGRKIWKMIIIHSKLNEYKMWKVKVYVDTAHIQILFILYHECKFLFSYMENNNKKDMNFYIFVFFFYECGMYKNRRLNQNIIFQKDIFVFFVILINDLYNKVHWAVYSSIEADPLSSKRILYLNIYVWQNYRICQHYSRKNIN